MVQPMTELLTILWLALSAVLPAVAAGGEVEQQPAVKFSEAETRMWMTNQLHSVTRPMDLHYEFHRTGSHSMDLNFDDKVELSIETINADGSKNGSLRFLPGTRAGPPQAIESSTVNLILGLYLSGDAREMTFLTDPDGKARERWRYFERGIKSALADTATVKATTFDFDGRRWNGYEISFTPYVKDPRRSLFEKFADKRYSVVVSDDLPGYLYRIETLIPSEDPAQPLIREVLQLTSVEPKK